MKIGDKVRFIHSKDQGIIKQVIDAHSVEVEIEDGFRIPILKKEIVVVAAEEGKKFTNESANQMLPSEEDPSSAVFIAFLPFNDNIYSLYIINNGGDQVLFTIHENGLSSKGVSLGILEPKTSEKVTEYKFKEFEDWPEVIVQCLFYRNGKSELKNPVERKFKFKAASFYKSKKEVPVLNKNGFVFPLEVVTKIDAKAIKEKLLTDKEERLTNIMLPESEVDLHIEKILTESTGLTSGEILNYQFAYFEKQLDRAIAHNLDQIIFIHGSGNGILKTKIHKKLSQNKNIKYYEEARKDKFGYGATLVRIK